MNYTEERDVSAVYKQNYIDGIKAVIDRRQKEAEQKRDEYIKDILTDADRYREDLAKMLGWPLVNHDDKEPPICTAHKLSDEDGYSIYRLEFEILDGVKMTGLFFKADSTEKRPLVIVQHGGLGTPELISGVYGNTSNYNDMLMRVRNHGVHVFAPQVLLWSEDYNVEFDRKEIDASLKRVGSSITAIEVHGIRRILDYFETQEYVSCFGMGGMSYGGFYTLYTTALEKRIKAALSCSFFNSRDAVHWTDWVWHNSGYCFDDAEVACLAYPRKLCLMMGDSDNLFKSEYSEKSFERIKKICKKVGTDWTKLIIFEGTHEFCKDDEPIAEIIKELEK